MPRLGFIASLVVIAALLVPAAAGADPGVAKDARYCPAGMSFGFKTKRIVGLGLPKAEKRAERNGCSVRVVKRNGQPLDVTADYVANRINVAVANDRVRRVLAIG